MKKIKDVIKHPFFILISLAFTILALVLLYEYRLTHSISGVPLDDVYIHFQFSRNIAEGNGFSFNPHEPTPGSTSPFWTILLTIPYLIVHNHIFIAKMLSAFFYIGIGVVTYILAENILKSKKQALVAGIFTLLSGRLVWSSLSGMEITLFTFLILLFLFFLIKRKNPFILMTILGISSTVRPEGYLISFLYIVSEFLILFKKPSRKKSLGIIIGSIMLYCCIIVPYILFSYTTTGKFVPNTFTAQSIVPFSLLIRIKSTLLYFLRYGYLLVTDNPIILLAIPFGIYSFFKSKQYKEKSILLIMSIIVLFPIIAGIIAPNLRHHGRYTIPFIPLYILVGIQGIKSILSTLYKHKYIQSPKIKTIIYTLIGIYLCIMTFKWSETFAWNVKNIDDMQVHLGEWVKHNTPEDSTIALNDIGAITYISRRYIIDTVGLVSPDVLQIIKGKNKIEKENALWKYLTEQKPDYVIIFPSWYPEIAQKKELKEIYRVQLDRYTIIDGEMVVYRYNNGG